MPFCLAKQITSWVAGEQQLRHCTTTAAARTTLLLKRTTQSTREAARKNAAAGPVPAAAARVAGGRTRPAAGGRPGQAPPPFRRALCNWAQSRCTRPLPLRGARSANGAAQLPFLAGESRGRRRPQMPSPALQFVSLCACRTGSRGD
jgi:hypothetical protein